MPNVEAYFRFNIVDRRVSSYNKVLPRPTPVSHGVGYVYGPSDRRFLVRFDDMSKYCYNTLGNELDAHGSNTVHIYDTDVDFIFKQLRGYESFHSYGHLYVRTSGRYIDDEVTDSPLFEWDIAGSNVVHFYDVFLTLPTSNVIDIFDPKDIQIPGEATINRYSSDPVEGFGSIQLKDLNALQVINRIPAGDDILVNPETSVSFQLLDESSGVDADSINITIDGVDVVVDGETQTGSFTLVKFINVVGPPPNAIDYTYTPNIPFEEGKNILIEVFAQDFASPVANVTDIGYSFRPWNLVSINGGITIDPDVDYPYITNMYPPASGTDIGVCTPILFDVLDDTTGFDLSSLVVHINSELVYSGSGQVGGDGQVSLQQLTGGYRFSYDLGLLPFDSTFVVQVSGTDLYTPGLHPFSDSYSFSTVSASSISIENFFMPMVGGTIAVFADTEISVDVLDYTYGISESGTKMFVDEVEVAPTFVPISGGYNLTYQPPNLFEQAEFMDVRVHAENLRTPSCPVFKEELYQLSYGYKVTVIPEELYEYDAEVTQLIEAGTIDRNVLVATEPYIFKTHAVHSKDLTASIDTRRRTKDLEATIAPVAPYFYYNKLITVRVEASDLDGNVMEPFEFTYRIAKKLD